LSKERTTGQAEDVC